MTRGSGNQRDFYTSSFPYEPPPHEPRKEIDYDGDMLLGARKILKDFIPRAQERSRAPQPLIPQHRLSRILLIGLSSAILS